MNKLPSLLSTRYQNRRVEKKYLCRVQPGARRWWVGASKQLTRGAATDSLPV